MKGAIYIFYSNKNETILVTEVTKFDDLRPDGFYMIIVLPSKIASSKLQAALPVSKVKRSTKCRPLLPMLYDRNFT
jgi:hypothetical protein